MGSTYGQETGDRIIKAFLISYRDKEFYPKV